MQMDKVGIAYVLPTLERGGAEKNVLDIASRIDRRRYAPCVVCTSEGGPLETEFRSLGIPVHILGYRGFSMKTGAVLSLLRTNFAAFGRYRDLLDKMDIRIIHAHLPEGNIVGTLSAPFFRRRVRIVSKHALCLYKRGHPIYSFMEDAANLLADAITVNSEAVAEDVRKNERFWGGKLRLIYNGIDSDAPAALPIEALFPGLPGRADDPWITYVANLFPYKGHLDLVEAARVVADDVPSVRFLLVGRDAGDRDAVHSRIVSLGLSENVILTGPFSDARKVIASSTFTVHPSHQEGFGNAILEAMAAGKAVVGTRVGGVPEVVIDGETGLLVPPHNPRALADAILALLRDPGRAREMGRAGRQRVLEHFSTDKMVAGVQLLYEDTLAGTL
jgi:glycosyltransferase involved in cell wall biosynthesis